MDEKRVPIMNFKIVNAKNFKMDLFIIYSLRFNSLAGTQRYKRPFVKKTQSNKIKDSGEAYDFNLFTDVLT